MGESCHGTVVVASIFCLEFSGQKEDGAGRFGVVTELSPECLSVLTGNAERRAPQVIYFYVGL